MSQVGNQTLDASDMISLQMIMAMWLFSTTSLLGIVGNILVLIAVSLSRQLQTSTNIFVVALASIDLFTCLLLPLQVVSLSGMGRDVSFAWVCTISAVCITTSLLMSFCILTLIAYNRFYMITKERVHYDRLFTKRNIAAMLAISGVAVLIFNVVLDVTGLTKFGYNDGICSPENSKAYSYPTGTGLIISLIVIVICYIKIYKHIKRHLHSVEPNQETFATGNIPEESPGIESLQKDSGARPQMVNVGFVRRQLELESKITANMLIVIVLCFVCMSPALIAAVFEKEAESGAIVMAIITFNSCLNPIVYAWKHPVFRHVFKCILTRRMGCIKERTQLARFLSGTHT